MQQLLDALPVLVVPFVMCLLIAALHCYMGLHVIKRGVIFVDLALAQCAALGAAVALFLTPLVWGQVHKHLDVHAADLGPTTEAEMADQLLADEGSAVRPAESGDPGAGGAAHAEHGHEEHARFAYGLSLVFALLGAVLLSIGRFRDERVPHEAIIGIIFVVCAALSVLILSKAPHGHEKMEAMLIGSILFVSWAQVPPMLLLYLVLGILHIAVRKRLIQISQGVSAAERAGIRVRYWDCLFYGTFALMVTQSVAIAGVLVVFSYLIIPAACAVLFADGFGRQLVVAWIVAVVTTVAGLVVSAVGDMPTGASLVSCFGAVLVLSALARTVLRKSG